MNAEITESALEINARVQAHEFTREAQGMLAVAQSYEIDTNELYQLAGSDLQRIKARATAIEEARLAITRPMDEAKKRVMEFFNQPLVPLRAAESAIKQAMLIYDQEQARLRREAEDAARKVREEQERLAREAEAAARKAAEDAAQKVADAKNKVALEQALQEAREAAERARVAEEATATLEHAPLSVVAPAVPRAAGISRRTVWRAEVVDLLALARAIAAGNAPITLIQPDMKALNGMARALKAAMNVPGVRTVEEEQLASRAHSNAL